LQNPGRGKTETTIDLYGQQRGTKKEFGRGKRIEGIE